MFRTVFRSVTTPSVYPEIISVVTVLGLLVIKTCERDSGLRMSHHVSPGPLCITQHKILSLGLESLEARKYYPSFRGTGNETFLCDLESSDRRQV